MNCDQFAIFEHVLHHQRGVWKFLVRLGHAGLERFSVAFEVWIVMTKAWTDVTVRFVQTSRRSEGQKRDCSFPLLRSFGAHNNCHRKVTDSPGRTLKTSNFTRI